VTDRTEGLEIGRIPEERRIAQMWGDMVELEVLADLFALRAGVPTVMEDSIPQVGIAQSLAGPVIEAMRGEGLSCPVISPRGMAGTVASSDQLRAARLYAVLHGRDYTRRDTGRTV
jgi:hypothetical protein